MLRNPVKRTQYDLTYASVQHAWFWYRHNLENWIAAQQAKRRQQQSPKAPSRRASGRADYSEQQRRQKEAKANWRRRHQEEEAACRAEEEADAEAKQQQNMDKERERREAEEYLRQEREKEERRVENLRQKWHEAEKRTREQRQRAEEQHRVAAEERLHRERQKEAEEIARQQREAEEHEHRKKEAETRENRAERERLEKLRQREEETNEQPKDPAGRAQEQQAGRPQKMTGIHFDPGSSYRSKDRQHRYSENDAKGVRYEQAERLRREVKQRQADERSYQAAAAARARQEAAAQDRLREQQEQLHAQAYRMRGQQQTDANTKEPLAPLNRKRPFDTSSNQSEQHERASKVPKVSTDDRGLRLHMARIHARKKHQDKLEALGGPGHEQELMGVYIELDWVKTEADGKCHFCRRNIQIEMFVCPEGGARACTPCKMKYSYYTSC
jgi:hypothetical protein